MWRRSSLSLLNIFVYCSSLSTISWCLTSPQIVNRPIRPRYISEHSKKLVVVHSRHTSCNIYCLDMSGGACSHLFALLTGFAKTNSTSYENPNTQLHQQRHVALTNSLSLNFKPRRIIIYMYCCPACYLVDVFLRPLLITCLQSYIYVLLILLSTYSTLRHHSAASRHSLFGQAFRLSQ